MLPQKNDLRHGFCCSFASVIYLRGFLINSQKHEKKFYILSRRSNKKGCNVIIGLLFNSGKRKHPRRIAAIPCFLLYSSFPCHLLQTLQDEKAFVFYQGC